MCQIKKSFTYYIIPIINPEGIILGNYRTNINGYDLNRNWRNPTIESQPEIFGIKKYLQKINKDS
jgi:murein tripeptide amidase MpaA